MANILVVDDELGIRDLLSEILNDEGHSVDLAENATQARAARVSGSYDLVLLDIWMPDTDGISLLKEWATGGLLTMPVIMMSGHATIDTAVDATRIGAFSFLEKPITLQKLLKAVEQGLAKPQPARTGPGETAAASLPPQRPDRIDLPGSEPVVISAAPVHGGYVPTIQNLNSHAHQAASAGITMASGPQADQSFNLDRPLREARDAFEKAYFEFHLVRENGSMTRVAERTGLERTHLYRKLKQLGVDLSRNKRGAG